jgi:hypothetical protein
MSFPRHGEIFPSDGGASPTANAPTHRLDESPAGYSLAGWSPPGPASASPTVYEYAVIPSCRSRSFHRTVNCVLTVCVSSGGNRTRYRGIEAGVLARPRCLSLCKRNCPPSTETQVLPLSKVQQRPGRRVKWRLRHVPPPSVGNARALGAQDGPRFAPANLHAKA